MKHLLAVAAAASLAGCAGTPKLSIAEQCAAYGFTPGTTAFAECQQREVLAQKERRAILLAGI